MRTIFKLTEKSSILLTENDISWTFLDLYFEFPRVPLKFCIQHIGWTNIVHCKSNLCPPRSSSEIIYRSCDLGTKQKSQSSTKIVKVCHFDSSLSQNERYYLNMLYIFWKSMIRAFKECYKMFICENCYFDIFGLEKAKTDIVAKADYLSSPMTDCKLHFGIQIYLFKMCQFWWSQSLVNLFTFKSVLAQCEALSSCSKVTFIIHKRVNIR